MASKFFDRVKAAVSGTPGTGNVSIGSAVPGYAPWSGVTNGAIVSYVLEDGLNFEVGRGTYTASGPTLARNTILASSSNGSPINASSSSVISVSFLAEDVADLNTAIAAAQTTANQALAASSGGSSGSGGGGSSGVTPTIVQGAKFVAGGNVPMNAVLPGAPTVGNMIVIVGGFYGGDSGPGIASGWNVLGSSSRSLGGAGTELMMVLSHKVVAGDTATFNPFTNANYNGAGAIYEVSGYNPADLTAATTTVPTPTTTNPLTSTITAPAFSLLLGCAFTGGNDIPTISNGVADYQGNGYLGISYGVYYGVQSFHKVETSAEVFSQTSNASSGDYLSNIMIVLRAPAAAGALVSLSDVDDSTPPTNGQVPTWNSGEGKFTFATPGGAAASTRTLAAARIDLSGAVNGSSGTNPQVQAGFNVASVSHQNTGLYRITFTTPLTNTQLGNLGYSGGGHWGPNSGDTPLVLGINRGSQDAGITTTYIDVTTYNGNGGQFDCDGWFSFTLYDVTVP